ncbi:DUF2087 domain-containing protein [Actinoplanes sp. NPDC051859]|uniref:DUF2087 domain-containing protein n=1 Tax=Actinoplanes sp. NPDC051859 TaxID=3363909 RepID=UPI00378B91A7
MEPSDETAFAPFIDGDRLRRLPAKRTRRHTVLGYLVETSFAQGTTYDETAVNTILLRWCTGSEVDHVAVRRYLIDHQLLFRSGGVYARSGDLLPSPGAAQRYLDAIGLD